jgi:hypothetical protein
LRLEEVARLEAEAEAERIRQQEEADRLESERIAAVEQERLRLEE